MAYITTRAGTAYTTFIDTSTSGYRYLDKYGWIHGNPFFVSTPEKEDFRGNTLNEGDDIIYVYGKYVRFKKSTIVKFTSRFMFLKNGDRLSVASCCKIYKL